MESERQRGIEIARQIMGEQGEAKRARDIEEGAFGSYLPDHALSSCWGTIWDRPGLDLKSRSIATIGMVMALAEPFALKNHIRGGLRLGITPTEIEEIVYQAIPYLGYPIAGVALRAAREVFTEDGLI